MLSVINGATETVIDDGTIAVLLAHDGWGMAPLKRLTERSPLQDGETDRGFHLEPRRGSLVLGLKETTLSGMYDKRDQILDIFKPQGSPILKWDLPNGNERRIPVNVVAQATFPWDAQKWAAAKLALDFEAPDPSFYDPTQILSNFHVASGGDLAVPIMFPIKFGSSIVSKGQTISYQGTWRTYPTVTLTGPMTNPIIDNLTLPARLALTYTLSAGSTITIDLSPGAKSVTLDDGTDLIGVLTDDSDIGTWRFETDPHAPGGDNSIKVQASGLTSASLIALSWYRRFMGI